MWCDDAPPTPNREPLSPSTQNKKQLLNPTSSRGDTRLKSCGFCSFCSFCSFCQNRKILKNAKIFYTKFRPNLQQIFDNCIQYLTKNANFARFFASHFGQIFDNLQRFLPKRPDPPLERFCRFWKVLDISATRCQIWIPHPPIDSQALTSKQICKHLRRATRSRKVV